jgi:hypothetical protein
VVVDGQRRLGTVVVGDDTPVPYGTILRVTSSYVAPVLGAGDKLVPQIEYAIAPEIITAYENLLAGSASQLCAERIAQMPSLHRTQIFTGLSIDRLRRKTERIDAIFETAKCDWHQTFHTLLLQAMGGGKNRETFTELASRATATMISREKNQLQKVESLLLGTAGFLFGGAKTGPQTSPQTDDYTLRLEEEFRHLAAKYSITPLKPAEWNLSKIMPANHPAVRLAEIAALLCKKDFMLDRVLRCRTSDDIEELFSATAGDDWRTHYKPSGDISADSPKRIGRAKTRLIGINLAAPLMFAYGKQTGRENLCEAALTLLEDLPAEKNATLNNWYERNCSAENAFESQAIIELDTEFCTPKRCAKCPIGRNEIKKVLG